MGICSCCSEEQQVIVLPSEEEIRNFSETDKAVVLIKEATAAFEALKNIPDITEEAKGSLASSKDTDKQLLAIKSLEPGIKCIADAYRLTSSVCEEIISILNSFVSNIEWKEDKLNIHSILCLLQCCVAFDSIKLLNPRIHNTLFFYRRCSLAVASVYQLPLSQGDSSQLTTFLAEPRPMQNLLYKKLSENQYMSILPILKLLCSSVVYELESNKLLSQQMRELYCHSLTAIILLLDSLQQGGIFTKNVDVDIISTVKAISLCDDLSKECLSIIRYSSETFAKPTTLRKIKKIVIEATD